MTFEANGRERSRAGDVTRRLWAWTALLILVLAAAPAAAQISAQVFFVPLPDEQVRTWAVAIDQGAFGVSDEIHTVISITVTLDGTEITYDHWEDSFEADPSNPFQATTEVWGDGSAATGCPPTKNGAPLTCSDANDTLDAGDVVALENDVDANPRNPAEIRFDGGDLIAASDLLAVTRAGWPVNVGSFSGVVEAGAVEVYVTSEWGLEYESPAGEDVGSNSMFEYSAFSIMAQQDNTLVSVDVDADGTVDLNQTLDQGESLLAENVLTGGMVNASAPVQVDLLTGDVNTTYEARWFTLVPTERWSSVYYSPVGETNAAAAVTVFAYNPGSSAITVNYETLSSSGDFDVQAGGFSEFTMPSNSGARFASQGTSGHGMAMWSAAATPEYDLWDGTNFTGPIPGENMVDMASRWRIQQGAAAPGRDEKIVIGIENGTEVSGQRWNGSTWSDLATEMSIATLGNVSQTFWWGGDVAYEQLSGDAILVWNDNPNLRYAVWNGSSWTGPATITSCVSGEPKQMKLAANPNSDEMVLVVNHQNETDCALVWNGSAWGNVVPLAASTSQDRTDIAVAYESLSGDAIVVFEDNTNPDTFYRIWNGSSWTTSFPITAPSGPTGYARWATMASDPSSDRIVLGVQSSDPDGWVAVWDGTSWEPSVLLTEGILVLDANTSPNVAVAFESSSGEALVTYGRSNQNVFFNRTWDSVAKWGTEEVANNLGDNTNSMTLDSDPGSDQIMLAIQNDDSNLNYILWNGSSWGTANGLEANTSETKNQPFAFVWNQFGDGATAPPEFFALSTIDYDSTTYDWGFTLIPEDYLSTAAVVGWAPGSEDLSQNGSPVWVTAEADTTLFVDYDGDGGSDGSFTLNRLESLRIFDPDRDQTGMRLFTTDGTRIIAAWGQDPATAGTGSPYLDLGTTVLPFVNPLLSKDSELIVDQDGDGVIEPGDTLLYTVFIKNVATAPMTDPLLVDDPDPNVTYVAGTAQIDGSPAPDDSLPATPFPFDDPGYTLPTLAPGESLVVTYHMQIDSPLAPGVTSLSNIVSVSSGDGTTAANAEADVPIPGLRIEKVSDASGAAVPGQVITYTMTVTNPGGVTFTGISVQDDLPEGTSYVAESTIATGPISTGFTDDFTDDFDADTGYSGSDGSQNFSGPWVENDNDGGGTTGGNIQAMNNNANCDSGGDCLRVEAEDVPDSIYRQADLSAYNSATLDYDWVVDANNGGTVILEASDDGGASYAVPPLATYNLSSMGDSTGSASLDLTPHLASNTRIRFRVTAGGGFTDGYLYVDNVSISATSSTIAVETKDNIPAGANPDLDDGTPADLVLASDDFLLAPGDTLTVTYQVQVNEPLDRNVTRILNTATASDSRLTFSVSDHAIDVVPLGALLGNSVWLDIDGDGIQDVGEDGLPNVVVELRDGVCTPGVDCPTTVTDAAGNYLFAYVYPGTYTVAVLSGLHPGLVPSPGNNGGVTDPIAVSGSQQFLDADFGYTAPDGVGGWGLIGNFVWSDADGDGLQDPGEPGIGNVTVELRGPGPDGFLGTADDVTVAVTSTAPDGRYFLPAFTAGQYQVIVTDMGAWLTGYTPTSGPQSEGGYVSAPVTVALGDVISDVDFGFDNDSLFSISDAVWLDSDNDGSWDASEAGIAGVTVNLRDALGNIIATTVSDASGNFSFEGLVDNSKYYVDIADATGQLAGLGGTTAPAEARQLEVSMSGADVTGTNFGYNAPASLRGLVWNDADGDGVRDPEEIGLGGVTVELRDGCTPGVDCPTTTTAADGSYTFVGLMPDLYTVTITDSGGILSGYTQTGDPDEAGTCSICDGLSSTVVDLISGDQPLDFGYRNGSLDEISGRIFDDEDADGVEDAGESGLAGVTVALLDDAGNVLATTTTDSSGDYVFPDLPAGSYSVRVTDEAGFLDGYSLTSGLDELSAQPGDSDVDFGYTRRPGTAAIGDRLWLDADADGQAGPNEAGLAGVTVELWEDTDGDGVLNPANDTLIASTVTDANGDYVFDGLSAGNYLVDVDETTLPVTASGDLVETSYPAGTDPSAVIALSATERFGGADFGYLPASGTAVLGDRVWYDADGNGLQDPGELGIGGVEIQLLGPGCDPTPCTVTTEPDGTWLVTGLAPGDFLITCDPATLPAGYNTIPTNLGGNDTYNLTVAANDVMTQLDFGFDGGTTGTIGDRVWLDEDGDGVQDVGEPGLAGVTVNLVDDSGDIIATTTTAADGTYLFSGVPDGNYTVEISDIDGILVGLPQSYDPDEPGVCSTCDRQGSVSVSGGVSTPADIDFGFAPSGGTGTIGDFVWHDADGDGVQDPGESGIQGVTLELWLDVNGDGVITPGLDNLVRNAVTDLNGEYQFNSLPDEDYVVRVTDTAGVVSAFVQTGDPDEAGTCTVCDEQGVLTLTGGSGDFGQDFGYAAPAGTAYSISGTVFDDQNQDGDFDSPGESGVEGALVLLFNDLNGDGVLDPDEPLLGSTVTDADGNYSLIGLPPGDYLVAVDTSGTGVDGYLQTTQTLTAGLQAVTVPTNVPPGNAIDQDFGFWSGGYITTPVTLAYFSSEGSGSVSFQWATATETGNLGFHLYVLEEEGLRRLNETLIPSQVGDALTPQRYALEAWGVEGDRFVLEDVDLYGQTRYHGPFELGRTYGSQVWNVKRTDWVGIRREHHRKAAARQTRRLEGLGGGSSMGSRPALGRAAPVYLRVREDGLYRVTYEALVAAGVDLRGVPAARLALLENGEPVPIRVGGPGRFGAGSFVEFVGRGLDTLYTDTNVYTLLAAPRYAARVGRDAAMPSASARIPGFYYETRTAEVNRAYDFAAPGDDPWYDTRLLAISGPVEAFFELELEDRLPEAGPVELTVELWGVTDFPQAPDHHVVLEVNGVELADEWFDGFEDRAVRAQIPDWLLGPGNNSLRVLLPHDTGALYDLVNYDRYRLRFPRRFEASAGRLRFSGAAEAFRVEGLPSADVVVYRVTEEGVEILEAVQISGLPGDYSATFSGSESPATYYVSTVEALQMPLAEPAPPRNPTVDMEAEMLIIAHPDFVDNLDPLVAARRSEGLSVQVVNVEELYHRFSHGVFDPQAIRKFIRRAYRKLGTRYVLLVGGDTYDYFDYLGGGAVSFVPTLYTQTDPIVRFAPVDPLYGDINSDGLPEVAVGRWPVRTTAELEAILDRTLRYADIDYARTAVFSADAYDAPAGYSFSAASEEMLGYLPGTWQAERVYLDELYLEEARQLLIDEINYGVALTSYFGHSGPSVWSFDGLFDSSDADALENFGRPTVITQWGCWNTYHVMPTYDTLGHRLLLNDGRGAAAVLGAATLTEALSEQKLGRRLFAQIGSQRQRLGKALIDAKKDLALTDPERLDVLLGWTLLGDPTLVVEP